MPLRHQHQGQPAGGGVHEIQHVHVHRHKIRRDRANLIGAAACRVNHVKAHRIAAEQHVARLFATHIAVTYHKITRLGQGMVKHHSRRRVGMTVVMLTVSLMPAAARI